MLEGIDVIVHLAARVHVLQPNSASTLDEFREVNVEGSSRLVAAAAKAGVNRVVFLSTIKVNGEETFGQPFRADQSPQPAGAYAISKFEAERRLRQLEAETDIDLVIIRPPLVYGPCAKGNLRSLAAAVERGWLLPFGAVRNRRDLVSVYNLCDLIVTCIDHAGAAGQTFLVSDGEPLSTPELVRRLAAASGTVPRLLRLPLAVLRIVGSLSGRTDQVVRLTGNLEIDTGPTREILGWVPPLTVAESFAKMYRELR